MTPPTDPLRQWAANLLGLPPDTTRDEARTAILRRLPEEQFLPPTDWRSAWDVLATPPSAAMPSSPIAWYVEDGQLRRQLAEFVDKFWEHELVERRQHWQELLDRAAEHPLVVARLRRLEPGLDVSAATVGDEPTAELAAEVRAQFVLPVTAAATRRRRFLERVRGQPRPWLQAAHRLRAERHDLARLTPDLLKEVLALTRRAFAQARRVRSRVFRALMTPLGQSPGPAAPRKSSTNSRNWTVVLFVLMVVFSGIARLMDSSKHKKFPFDSSSDYTLPVLRTAPYRFDAKTLEELRRRGWVKPLWSARSTPTSRTAPPTRRGP